MFKKQKIKSLLVLVALTFCLFAWGEVAEASSSHRVSAGDTLWLISQKYNTDVSALTSTNGLSNSTIYPEQVLKVPEQVHTVSKGDTMWLISQWYGVKLSELISFNPNLSESTIYPGQKVNIPPGSGNSSNSSSSSSKTLSSRSGSNYSQQDIDLFARLVYSEAAGESYTGQVAVAASVLNRLDSSRYPDSLRGVILQVVNGHYQYSPVLDGRINLPASQTAYQAVYDALQGWDPSGGALGFYNPRKTSNQWVRQQSVTTVIGGHVFFR